MGLLTEPVPRTDRSADGPPVSARRQPPPRLAAATFLLPAVAVVAIVLLLPFVVTVVRSFLGDGPSAEFVGFDNYVNALGTPEIRRSLLNTLLWVAGSLLLPVGLGLAIAALTESVGWGPIARTLIVLPYAISGTAVAVVASFLLRSDGAINQLLRGVGLDGLAKDWLLSWPSNVLSTIAMSTWQGTGVAVILFVIGLQAIPSETIEAAALDGAVGWARFRYILLPQLRPVTVVVVGITLANALKTFDLIWVLTQGGPARESETLAASMYREAFLLQRVGGGTAIGVVLAIVVVAVSWLYLRAQLTPDKEGRRA